MDNSRRKFLKNFSAIGAGIVYNEEVLQLSNTFDANRINMYEYTAPKLDVVRIGFIGLGNRGSIAVKRINNIKNISITALCDIRPEKLQAAKNSLKDSIHSPACYQEKEDWKRVCERTDVDVIYICTQWDLHSAIALYAMQHGKHVALEVAPANSLEECWSLVNVSEKHKKHCIFLENCCFDFFELLTLNMVRKGFFGEIIHCEGAYIHDIAESLFRKDFRYNYWRLRENANRNGNLYPTHGLGPICNIMNINRGDKLDYLVSISSNDFTLKKLEEEAVKKDPEAFKSFSNKRFRGNMNTSIIRTAKGKTIMLQHDTSSPRVYSRLHTISGTIGAAQKYPTPKEPLLGRISVGHEDWLSEKETLELQTKYKHPLVKRLGDIAKKIGGHGGMDFLMDWRWIDCLRNGLPIENNVYDAALWRAIGPLSEKSVANRGLTVNVPDFTRGHWSKNRPVDFYIDHNNLTGIEGVN